MMIRAIRAMFGLHPSDWDLGAYVGGELGATDSRAVADHLQRCERCRLMVETQRAALESLASTNLAPKDAQIQEMLAAGRARLLQSFGEAVALPSDSAADVCQPTAEAARLIFGCRMPLTESGAAGDAGSQEQLKLEQMCVAMLGSKIGEFERK